MESGVVCTDSVKASMTTVTSLIRDFKEIFTSIMDAVHENSGEPDLLIDRIIDIFETIARKARQRMDDAQNIPFDTCIQALESIGAPVAPADDAPVAPADDAPVAPADDARVAPASNDEKGFKPLKQEQGSMDFMTGAFIERSHRSKRGNELSDTIKEVGATVKKGADEMSDTIKDAGATIKKGALSGRDVLVLLVTKMKNIVPALQGPMNQIIDVSSYISGALECGKNLIPPVKTSVEIVSEVFKTGVLDVNEIETKMMDIANAFKGPMVCTGPKIIDPLQELFESKAPKKLKQILTDKEQEIKQVAQKMIAQAKRTANAIVKVIPLVEAIIKVGVKVYLTVKDVVDLVKKFIQNPSGGGGAFQEAMGGVRQFKQGVAEIIMVLRDLRGTLHLLPMDDGTMLAVLEGAEKVLVGLDGACDVVVELLETPATDQDAAFFETHALTTQRPKNHRRKLLNNDLVSDGPPQTPSKADTEKMLRVLESKIDTLQATSDKISQGIRANGGGGGGGGGKGGVLNREATSEDALRKESKKFQRSIEVDAEKLKCPSTHTESTPAQKQLLITKEIDLVVERIIVPPDITYGVDVKVGIMIRAVATAYMDWVTCDCTCSISMTKPCSEIMMIGPSIQAHIIGTGAVSVGIKILSIAGTVNLQLASIYADTAVHISRVAKQKLESINPPLTDQADKATQLCVKDLPSDQATFGAGFKASLAAEILKGSFQLQGK